MSVAFKHLLYALDVVFSEPRPAPASIPCPCGSGVIEDDCECQQTPPRCETCWHRQAECECCQDCADGVCEVCEPEVGDSAEVRYVDSLGMEDLL